MPRLKIVTIIKADINVVFDLSRSVELHQLSTKNTYEKAIAGKMSGLMELNDSVTWRAKHFGLFQELTTIITTYDRPISFTDVMQKGIFQNMEHQHIFKSKDGGTIMTDLFDYKAPLGFIGTIAERLFLSSYLRNFLLKRNATIKHYAEGTPEAIAQIRN